MCRSCFCATWFVSSLPCRGCRARFDTEGVRGCVLLFAVCGPLRKLVTAQVQGPFFSGECLWWERARRLPVTLVMQCVDIFNVCCFIVVFIYCIEATAFLIVKNNAGFFRRRQNCNTVLPCVTLGNQLTVPSCSELCYVWHITFSELCL